LEARLWPEAPDGVLAVHEADLTKRLQHAAASAARAALAATDLAEARAASARAEGSAPTALGIDPVGLLPDDSQGAPALADRAVLAACAVPATEERGLVGPSPASSLSRLTTNSVSRLTVSELGSGRACAPRAAGGGRLCLEFLFHRLPESLAVQARPSSESGLCIGLGTSRLRPAPRRRAWWPAGRPAYTRSCLAGCDR
jgi:hypothetical protein